MSKLVFDLSISSEDFLAWYQGDVNRVFVYARNGKSLSFPAQVLRPFVQRDGVHGTFIIEFDEFNKFVSIKRLVE